MSSSEPKTGMSLETLLRKQGFAGRKDARKLIRKGRVCVNGTTVEDYRALVPTENLILAVDDIELPYREELHLLLHKPAEAECSRIPRTYRSVFSFFPDPFLRRDLQPVGRLDAETTGLLIFTTSGELNHRISSPKRHLPKTYRVTVRHPMTESQVRALRQGVELRGEKQPTAPSEVQTLDEKQLLLTIHEGKYHQVKRMLAAVGNRVVDLCRVRIGPIGLVESLPPGEWRYLSDEEVRQLWSYDASGT